MQFGEINDVYVDETAHHQLPTSAWGTPRDSYAHFVRAAKTRTRVWVPGTSSWRRTETATTYDPDYAQPTLVQDKGDTTTTSDDLCTTTTYARNLTTWMIDFPAQSTTTDCQVSPTYLAGTQILYDDDTLPVGTAPTRGLVKKSLVLATAVGATLTWKQSARATYDANGRILDAYDPLNRKTSTTYVPSSGGPLTGIELRNELSHLMTTTLSPAFGLPTQVSDSNLKVTDASYDPLGRLLKVWLPGRSRGATGNQEHVYTIRASGSGSAITTKVLGPNDNQLISHDIFDGLLRQRQSQGLAPDGNRVIADITYDERGLAVKASTFYNSTAPSDVQVGFSDANVPRQATTVFDTLNRPTDVISLSLGTELWRTHTDYGGDQSTVTPPAGGTKTTSVVDARGRITELRQYSAPSGPYDTTTYSYDRLGRLLGVTDPVGNDWSYTYDLRGRQTAVDDPDAGDTTREYDDAGQVTKSTDGRGKVLSYVYDGLGRLTERHDITSPPTDILLATWTYDTLQLGQLTSSVRRDALYEYTSEVLTYNDLYQPTSQKITIPGDPTLSGVSGSYTFNTTYKPNGFVATQSSPAIGGLSAETVTSTYTAQGRLATLTGLSTYLDNIAYDWDDQITRQTLGSGNNQALLSADYEDGTGRLLKTQVHTEHPGTPETWDEVVTEQYRWHHAGTLQTSVEQHNSATTSAQCFTYDYLMRLTEARTNAAFDCATAPASVSNRGLDAYWTTWAFDKTGNRTSQLAHSTTGGANVTTTYTYPAAGANQPHTLTNYSATTGSGTFTYDASGNTLTRNVGGTTQTLTWDSEGHLATHVVNGQTSSYLYDANGTRLLRRDPNGATLYLLGMEVRRSNSATVTATRFYPNAVRTSAGLTWTAGDHHGTQQTTIDASTLAVSRRLTMPYGEPRGSQPGWPTDHGFLDAPTDVTGLTHLGAREYDPTTGRFVSVDPLVNTTDPQQMHGYSYASNNPTSTSDPSGMLEKEPKPSYDPAAPVQILPPRNPPGSIAEAERNLKEDHEILVTQFLATFTDGHPICVAHPGECIATRRAVLDGWDVTKATISILCGGVSACIEAVGNNDPETVLTLLGLIPVVGELADAGSAGIALSKGDYTGFLLSVAAMVPFLGEGAGAARLGRLAGKTQAVRRLCSFAADTQILLADGATKAIKDAKVGDLVQTVDPESGRTGSNAVSALWIHQDTLVELELSSGRLVVTEDHPFYSVSAHQWLRADELIPGEQLLASDGTYVYTIGIESRTARTAEAYNLTVADIHTYYVVAGGAAVLVHNTNEGCELLYKAPRAGMTDKLLKDGFDPMDFPGSGNTFPDGRAYFGLGDEGQDIALDYSIRRGYDPVVIQVRIPKADFERYFRAYVESHNGIPNSQVAIPNTVFNILNQYPRELASATR